MSIKSRLTMLTAIGLMFGGQGMVRTSKQKYTEPKRKLTPEEEAEILKQRVAKFKNELLEENQRLSHEHKNWRCHLVNDRWWIVASNQKNAIKKFNYLLKSNYLLLEHLVDS